MNLPLIAVILAGLAAGAGLQAQTAREHYDLLITGGRVLDGAGNPWVRADLAVRGDRIAAIGRLEGASARRTIDARNRIVAPGFIDMHSHSDFTLLVDGRAESKVRQGVTTELLGESGSAAPVTGPTVESMRNILAPLELTADWTDFAGYFARVGKQGISVNIATLVGSGQVRASVIGYENRPPSPDELARMKGLVREAMDQGAFGLSSALIYPPNSFMTTGELVELAREAARSGGRYMTHVRNEGETLLEAVREAIEIGSQARLPVHIFHLKASGPMKGRILEAARLIDEARGQGIDLTADQYPYVAGLTGLASCIPSWAHEGGRRKLMDRLREPKLRERIKAEMKTGSPGWYNFPKETGSFENIRIASVRTAANKKYEGWSVAAIGRERGTSPEDALMDLLLEEEGGVMAIYFMMSEEDVKAAMKLPWVSISSDGSAMRLDGILGRGKPHPRLYGTHPRVLGKYVREERVLTLEDAVRKMTSLPAAQLGLGDRGLLKPGMFADVVIFDPERVKDRATFENPHQYAEGIDVVIVNGEVVLDEDRHTGATPGRVLYGPGYRRARPPGSGAAIER